MASTKLDLHRQLATIRGLSPAARTNGTANGATLDRSSAGALNKGTSAVSVFFYAGVWTDGTHTPKVQDSDDNSVWNDAAAADVVGTFTAVTSAATDVVIQAQSYIGTKRYVRGVITTSGATTGALSALWYTCAGSEGNTSFEAA